MEVIKSFNEDFAVIHAYLCADGYVCRVNPKHKSYALGLRNTNLTLLEDFQKRFELLFGITPHISKAKDRCSISSKEIHHYLIHTFGSFHSYEWKVPLKFISRRTCAFWLRSFFDCESWVMRQRAKNRAICLDSVNLSGLKDVQKLLFNYFRIPSKLNPKSGRNIFTLSIYGKKYLSRFQQKIGFLHEKKKERLQVAIASYVDYSWKFPKAETELKEFIISKMKERAKAHKPKYVKMCSIYKRNLIQLAKGLQRFFSIKANINGPRFNSAGVKYYEFSINRRNLVQKVLNNNLLSESQNNRLTSLLSAV